MVRMFAACLVMVIACSLISTTNASTLADQVKAFNEEVRSKNNAKSQQPLTATEVVASIRAMDRDDLLKRGANDADYERFQQVAETGELPEGSKFTCITRYTTTDHVINVWWVDLYLPAKPEDRFQWTHRIRDRKISSRSLTEAERRMFRERQRQLQTWVPTNDGGKAESPNR